MTDNDINKLVGDPFEELSLEEMALAQGSGDVQPQTTPGCVATAVLESAAASSGWCGAGAATGSLATLSIKRCGK